MTSFAHDLARLDARIRLDKFRDQMRKHLAAQVLDFTKLQAEAEQFVSWLPGLATYLELVIDNTAISEGGEHVVVTLTVPGFEEPCEMIVTIKQKVEPASPGLSSE